MHHVSETGLSHRVLLLLYPVEELKYLGVLFMGEGRVEREMDRVIGVMSTVQMLYQSVVVKRAECQSIYVLSFIIYELWVATKRMKLIKANLWLVCGTLEAVDVPVSQVECGSGDGRSTNSGGGGVW